MNTADWARTPRGKLICPDCGATGWSGGRWLRKHEQHTAAPCGRVRPSTTLSYHLATCDACKAAG